MADTSVPTTSVSKMMMMPMTLMYPPATVASIPSGSTLSGSGPVDHNAEGPSVNVLETTSLINVMIYKEERREMNYAPNQVKLLFAAPSRT